MKRLLRLLRARLACAQHGHAWLLTGTNYPHYSRRECLRCGKERHA